VKAISVLPFEMNYCAALLTIGQFQDLRQAESKRPSADKMVMKSHRILAFGWVLALMIGFGANAHAFGSSEEEQLQIDLREARARATDFKGHIQRLEEAQRKRDQYAQDSKDARVVLEAQQERDREVFVEKRNSVVPDDTIRDRQEIEFNLQAEREDARMNLARVEFLRKKRAVAETIEREASIDENVEFDLQAYPKP
jgi:hypothetical protein